MVAKGVPAELMTAVPMGFQPASELPAFATTTGKQMVYLGTLLKTRKIEFLVRVLELVLQQEPEASLLIIGPEELPGDAKVIEDEADRLNIRDRVTLTGRMERDSAFELVRECAVCFSPFYPTPILNSTSPTKLIEYFSLGKAAVANDHPEQRQVIEDSGGGFCVAYDEQAFADAAVKLLRDPETARDMGRMGYNYAMANRTYEVLAARVEHTYDQIAQKIGRT